MKETDNQRKSELYKHDKEDCSKDCDRDCGKDCDKDCDRRRARGRVGTHTITPWLRNPYHRGQGLEIQQQQNTGQTHPAEKLRPAR